MDGSIGNTSADVPDLKVVLSIIGGRGPASLAAILSVQLDGGGGPSKLSRSGTVMSTIEVRTALDDDEGVGDGVFLLFRSCGGEFSMGEFRGEGWRSTEFRGEGSRVTEPGITAGCSWVAR